MRAFFFFLLLSLPKPLPVVKLFDVEDFWTAFSRDFTKAFGFARVVFSKVSMKESSDRNEAKTHLKPFLSLAVCF